MILDGVGPPPPWEQAPGYAYCISWIYALVGAHPEAVVAFQVCLSTVTCLLIYQTTHHLAGRSAALAAGLMAAVYGPFIYFQAELLPESLLVFLLAAALAAATRTPQGAWTTTGLLWAAAYVVRSNAVLGFPLAFAHAWARSGRSAAVAVATPFVFAFAGLFVINATIGGTPVASTTSGGVNFWLGNNPTADGVNPFFGPAQQATDAAVRAAAESAADADRLFSTLARGFWAEHPGDAVALAFKKLVWTMSDRELPNNADIEWRRSHSPIFALPLLPLSFGLLIVLALAAIAAGHRPRGANGLALLAPMAIALCTCVLFFTNARFRLPLALPLLVTAGIGGAALVALRRPAEIRTSVAGRVVLAVLLGAALSWGNWFGIAHYRIAQIDVNTGASARASGDLDAAIRFLELGVEREPRDGIGWIHLALAFEQQGRIAEARNAYVRAAANLPNDAQVRVMHERFEARHGHVSAETALPEVP